MDGLRDNHPGGLTDYLLSQEALYFLVNLLDDTQAETLADMLPNKRGSGSNARIGAKALRNIALITLLKTGSLEDFVLRSLDFKGVSLAAINQPNIVNCDLDRCNFNSADLRGANFLGSSLRDATLENAILDDGDFRKVRFDGAKLVGISATGTRLHGAKFRKVEISRAELGTIMAAAYNEVSANAIDDDDYPDNLHSQLKEAIENLGS